MTLQTPTWVNAEFVQGILKNSESDETIEVKNITTKPATGNGDNYMSDIVRVGVEYSSSKSGREITQKTSLLVKIALTVNEANRELLEVFKTEIQMMENTLVKMNDVLKEQDYRLSARVLYSEMGDPSFIVLEDLAPIGYRMADRQAGLDLQHCILAMRGLAKFHASSVAVCEKEPEQKLSYTRGMYHKDYPETAKTFTATAMRGFSTEVATWSELENRANEYSEKLLKLSKVCYDRGIESIEPIEDEFQVINHGDFWVNNMLFRYNENGNVTDHIFVDFQVCFWSSPAIDILYFLNTSTSCDVYVDHREALIEEYHDTLTKTMIEIECETQPPSMAALQKSLKYHGYYGFMSACLTLPFALMDKSDTKKLDEILNQSDNYQNPAYKGQAYRKIMLSRLDQWNAQGLFDL